MTKFPVRLRVIKLIQKIRTLQKGEKIQWTSSRYRARQIKWSSKDRIAGSPAAWRSHLGWPGISSFTLRMCTFQMVFKKNYLRVSWCPVVSWFISPPLWGSWPRLSGLGSHLRLASSSVSFVDETMLFESWTILSHYQYDIQEKFETKTANKKKTGEYLSALENIKHNFKKKVGQGGAMPRRNRLSLCLQSCHPI